MTSAEYRRGVAAGLREARDTLRMPDAAGGFDVTRTYRQWLTNRADFYEAQRDMSPAEGAAERSPAGSAGRVTELDYEWQPTDADEAAAWKIRAEEAAADGDRLRQQNHELRGYIDRLRADLDAAKAEVDGLRRKFGEMTHRLINGEHHGPSSHSCDPGEFCGTCWTPWPCDVFNLKSDRDAAEARAAEAERRITAALAMCDEFSGKPYWNKPDSLAAVRAALSAGGTNEEGTDR